MMSQLVLLIIFGQILQGQGRITDDQDRFVRDVAASQEVVECERKFNRTAMEFFCPNKFTSDKIEIDDLDSTVLESIIFLRVAAESAKRGPLKTIPTNICRLRKLQILDLSSNRIDNLHQFNWMNPCLTELRVLKLSDNRIEDISVTWFNRLPLLEYVDLSSNHLTNVPYEIFRNLQHLHTLDVSNNYLTSIELWTILIHDTVNYQYNEIDHFSNDYNADLSQVSSRQLPKFQIDKRIRIQFDDTIYTMYNRCAEVHHLADVSKNYTPTLTMAVLSILKLINTKPPFYDDCSCDRFHFYRMALAIEGYPKNVSADNWICSGRSTTFIQKCKNRSSADFDHTSPRLCDIHQSETGHVSTPTQHPRSTITSTPQQMTTIDLEEIERRLGKIGVLNNSTLGNFTFLINLANDQINVDMDVEIPEETKTICQKIIHHIEDLIQSVDSSLNTSDRTVGLISTTKTNPIYDFNQHTLPNSSIIHSSHSNLDHSIANIIIHEQYIQQLSTKEFYSFFFLPSSLFEYAQVDSRIEILSPIVGAHLSIDSSFKVQISLNAMNPSYSSGNYSCVFWQFDRWNTSGCQYSMNSKTNRHECHCDHLTSFALIFTPDGILPETFLPTIITSFLSIIGLGASIILSIHQQIKARHFRRYSAMNIFSLSSTLLFFILFTSLLIINHHSSRISSTTFTRCSSSMLNLVLTIYFFLLLTFASKTLLGIYYYSKTFGDFQPQYFIKHPNRCYLASISIAFTISLLLTIIASAVSHQTDDIIASKNNICWFRGSYLIGFVTIPVSIFIGVNILIVLSTACSLFRFLYNTKVNHVKEKRLIVIMYIWIASCVLLGIVWIAGPLLNIFVNENGESTSTGAQAMQWIFALFTGLEGVSVLIVNILFCLRQRTNQQSHRLNSSRMTKRWQRVHNLEVSTVNHQNYHK